MLGGGISSLIIETDTDTGVCSALWGGNMGRKVVVDSQVRVEVQ